MGNCGSTEHPNPADYQNCSTVKDEIIDIDKFCTVAGVSEDRRRKDFCNEIGDNEWNMHSEGDSCVFDDCHPGRKSAGGCCNGCCGIDGKGVKCVRVNFRGSHDVCCFKDYLCNSEKDPNTCFDAADKRRTCGLEYRDLGSSECYNQVTDVCNGNRLLPLQKDWTDAWTSLILNETNEDYMLNPYVVNGACLTAINRSMSNICNFSDLSLLTPAAIQKEGFRWSQKIMEDTIRNYETYYGPIMGKQDVDGSINMVMKNIIWDTCNSFPGLCKNALENSCVNYSPEDMIGNPDILQWCGCYLSDQYYSKYVDRYGINKECTPLCNRAGNIPLSSDDGLYTKICKQNICLMDDVTLDIVSSVYDNIEFGQICNGCGKIVQKDNSSVYRDVTSDTQSSKHGSKQSTSTSSTNITNSSETTSGTRCNCIMDNSTIDIVNTKIGGNINLIQNCGTMQCHNADGDPISCGSSDVIDILERKTAVDEKPMAIAALLTVGGMILLFIILKLLVRKRK